MNIRAKKLIKLLRLHPHIEGGFYNEVFRSKEKVFSTPKTKKRDSVSDIYFLLTSERVSKFHKLTHDEIWHFYEGGPIEITEIEPGTLKVSQTIIGNTGKVLCYKHVVKAGNWQAAHTHSPYSLVGCTVAPGFEFEDFKLLKDNWPVREKVIKRHPGLAKLI